MMITGKVWGTTRVLLATPFIEVHLLQIQANASCSMHVHQFKFNAFVVLEGELLVDVEKRDYPLTDTTLLKSGELTTVRPGEYHRFRTGLHACRAMEMYYCQPLGEDIDRRGHGEVLKPGAKNCLCGGVLEPMNSEPNPPVKCKACWVEYPSLGAVPEMWSVLDTVPQK